MPLGKWSKNEEHIPAQFYDRVPTTCNKYATAYKVQSWQTKLPWIHSAITQTKASLSNCIDRQKH